MNSIVHYRRLSIWLIRPWCIHPSKNFSSECKLLYYCPEFKFTLGNAKCGYVLATKWMLPRKWPLQLPSMSCNFKLVHTFVQIMSLMQFFDKGDSLLLTAYHLSYGLSRLITPVFIKNVPHILTEREGIRISYRPHPIIIYSIKRHQPTS